MLMPSSIRQLLPWHVHLIGTGALIVLTAAAYLVQIRPLLNRRDMAMADRQALTDAQEKLASLERSQRLCAIELAQAKNDLKETRFNLQPVSQLNQRITDLSECAGTDGLQLDTIEPRPGQGNQRYATTEIRIAGRGRYADVTRFLRHVHESFRDSSVQHVQLSAQTGAKSTAAFAIDLVWYTLPSSTATAK